jgi:hypothetical protein
VIPYYSRWIQFAHALEEARAMAINLGSVQNVDADVDPSIERFGGTEAQLLELVFDDIREAFDFDDERVRGAPMQLRYRTGELTGERRRLAERGGGKRRAAPPLVAKKREPLSGRVKRIKRLGRGL